MTSKPAKGYRRNVGIAVFNRDGRVLLAERSGTRGGWQMPQGGLDKGEDPWAGALRELKEEIGTASVEYLGEVEPWLRYDYPEGVNMRHAGQEQKWFAVRFIGQDGEIDLTAGPEIEFSSWRWGTLSEAVELIVDFKRPVYEEMVRCFRVYERTND